MTEFTLFNLAEGVFWFFCALISLFARARMKTMPKGFWSLLVLLFVLFGTSDLIEAYYPVSFLEPGGYWLLGIKGVCVLGLLVCAFFYVGNRFKK